MPLTPEQQAAKEAAALQTKIQFASRCRELARRLGSVFSESEALKREYATKFSDNPLAEEDLYQFDFTLSELQAFAGMLQELSHFAGNEPVTQGEWMVVNNQLT